MHLPLPPLPGLQRGVSTSMAAGPSWVKQPEGDVRVGCLQRLHLAWCGLGGWLSQIKFQAWDPLGFPRCDGN